MTINRDNSTDTNILLYLECICEGNSRVVRRVPGTFFYLGLTINSIIAIMRHSESVYLVLVYSDVKSASKCRE